MEKWIGKVAIVTGASAGIGEGIVKSLAKSGIHVVGLARRSEKVDEYVQQLGKTPGTIYSHKCDVSDLQSVKEAFKWIEEKFGFIHILINNAGVAYKMQILDEADVTEKIDSILKTNVSGLVYCTREAVRLMKKADDYGMIVNVGSIVGHNIPFRPNSLNMYAPSKYAVTAVSEVLRQELINQNNQKIRVTNLSPGHVRTDMATPSNVDPDEYYATKSVLMPEDVALTINFLLETPVHVNISQLTIKPVGEQF
ncbi:CLUMA_CG015214, isoform A [Clunio marinus]|uniref:CLUMA_CG015214, isoform A n=1 Tax=Clunio marinus TaxID=568069 RepID=A0A1J1IQ05_9DIPT|nr:CLUMA_CG015214, isoform A [Clunio marinus]